MPNPDGFTSELEAICAATCAEFGDPPCWRLPELVEPCDQITPCDECLAALKQMEQSDDL